jgi:hypothetical protein
MDPSPINLPGGLEDGTSSWSLLEFSEGIHAAHKKREEVD